LLSKLSIGTPTTELGACCASEALHAREDADALVAYAARRVPRDPRIVLDEEERLLVARAAPVAGEAETIELGEVDVGDTRVAADRQHVLVVVVGGRRAEVGRARHHDRIASERQDHGLEGDCCRGHRCPSVRRSQARCIAVERSGCTRVSMG
jgi:hypothetical protein